MKELATAPNYWESTQFDLGSAILPRGDDLRCWIEEMVPGGSGRAIEIGCFPGRILACFGELGYELHGVDFLPEVRTRTPVCLAKMGYRVGEFHAGNFFDFQPEISYDVVSSFGFIEHFDPWEPVLDRHAELVSEKGYLVVTTPNFTAPLHHFVQRHFNAERFKGHNLKAMVPELWARRLEERQFEVLFCGAFGKPHFWVNEQERSVPAKVAVHVLVDLILPILKRLPIRSGHRAFAPSCGVIARMR